MLRAWSCGSVGWNSQNSTRGILVESWELESKNSEWLSPNAGYCPGRLSCDFIGANSSWHSSFYSKDLFQGNTSQQFMFHVNIVKEGIHIYSHPTCTVKNHVFSPEILEILYKMLWNAFYHCSLHSGACFLLYNLWQESDKCLWKFLLFSPTMPTFLAVASQIFMRFSSFL